MMEIVAVIAVILALTYSRWGRSDRYRLTTETGAVVYMTDSWTGQTWI